MATGRGREATATNSQMMSSIYSKIWIHFLVTNMALVAPKFHPLEGLTFWLYAQALSKLATKCSPRSKIQDSGGGYRPNDKFMWFARKPRSSKAASHSDFDR